jgi:predicted transcriptional regulator
MRYAHPRHVLRKDQAAELLRQGLPPSEIARQMGTSTAAVMQYLALKIGEGDLRRSDIAFSLPHELRIVIEDAIEQTKSLHPSVITRHLRKHGVTANRLDIGVYIQYRRARVVLGDMYELLRNVEVRLHTFIKQAFILEYGEEQWWRSGVPDTIRAECAALLEKDPDPADEPYCYTHVISLREILDKRWPVLSKYMPPHLLNSKKDLLERLRRLNRIRNSVMHPVRNSVLTEDDFEFVHTLNRDLTDLEAHLREGAQSEADPVPDAEKEELVSKLTPVSTDSTHETDQPEEPAAEPGEFMPSTKPEEMKKAG